MMLSKVVIPAAGLDTAFLPITKALPREMLPILEKPALQYVVEEALRSQVTNICMVTGKKKQLVADFFDSCFTLDAALQDRRHLLADFDKILKSIEFSYLRQSEPMGSGHAVWLARHMIHKEYFGVMMPDDIIVSKVPALEQLVKVARQEKGSVIAVQEVSANCASQYGMVKIRKQITPNLFQLSGLIEKPKPKEIPSNLAIVGRYVLSPKIFEALEGLSGSEDQICLTNAIDLMLRSGEKVFAYKVPGIRFDVGTPAGWIKAVVGMALQDKRYSDQIKKFIESYDTPDSFLYQSSQTIEHSL